MKLYTEAVWNRNNSAIDNAEDHARRLQSLLWYTEKVVINDKETKINKRKTFLESEVDEIHHLCNRILSNLNDYRR